jgi:ABC-type nitrate/sulfonate/bicarbonate transport system ATPase subunit
VRRALSIKLSNNLSFSLAKSHTVSPLLRSGKGFSTLLRTLKKTAPNFRMGQL